MDDFKNGLSSASTLPSKVGEHEKAMAQQPAQAPAVEVAGQAKRPFQESLRFGRRWKRVVHRFLLLLATGHFSGKKTYQVPDNLPCCQAFSAHQQGLTPLLVLAHLDVEYLSLVHGTGGGAHQVSEGVIGRPWRTASPHLG